MCVTLSTMILVSRSARAPRVKRVSLENEEPKRAYNVSRRVQAEILSSFSHIADRDRFGKLKKLIGDSKKTQ